MKTITYGGRTFTIMCARCLRPVKDADWSENSFHKRGIISLRAYCHGEWDQCDVDARTINPQEIVGVNAFTNGVPPPNKITVDDIERIFRNWRSQFGL